MAQLDKIPKENDLDTTGSRYKTTWTGLIVGESDNIDDILRLGKHNSRQLIVFVLISVLCVISIGVASVYYPPILDVFNSISSKLENSLIK